MTKVTAVKTTGVGTALANQERKPVTLQSLVEQSAKELARALPDHMKPERVVRIALTCIRMNPKLSECTPESFMGALFTAAQLGVEPIAGKAHILPFNNRRKIDGQYVVVKEAQFILGYPGLVDLFYRHERSMSLSWGVVKEGDEFDYSYGTDSFIKHKPAAQRGRSLYYYVIANLRGDVKPFMVMSYEECMDHGKRHSKTWQDTKWVGGQKVDCEGHFDPNSPWSTDEDSMCLKTTFVQLAKTLPKSSEVQLALANDETSREYRHGMASILDYPADTGRSAPPALPFPGALADKKAIPGRDTEGFATDEETLGGGK